MISIKGVRHFTLVQITVGKKLFLKNFLKQQSSVRVSVPQLKLTANLQVTYHKKYTAVRDSPYCLNHQTTESVKQQRPYILRVVALSFTGTRLF